MRTTLAIATIVLLSSTPAGAAPLPCARPEFEVLRPLVGDWRVEAHERVAPGQYEDVEATAEIREVLEGCSLIERFQGTWSGRPFEAVATMTVTDSMRLERTWMDSEHGRTMLLEGTPMEGGVEWTWSRDLGDRALMVRHVVSSVTPDSFVTEGWLSSNSGEEWSLTHRRHYIRVGRSP